MRPDGLVEDFIRVMEDKGANADVTLESLVLGGQDSETGWYGAAYNNSTIKMIILPRGKKEYEVPAGHAFSINFAGFTASQVLEGDLIVAVDHRLYHVISVTPHAVGNITIYYELELAYNGESDIILPDEWELIEGNFTSWVLQWVKIIGADWGISSFGVDLITFNESTDRLLMWYGGGPKFGIAKLSDGTLIETPSYKYSGGAAEAGSPSPSALGTYFAEVTNTGSFYELHIYKNGTLIQSIDLNTVLSIGYLTTRYFQLAFSAGGKYLTVSGYNWWTGNTSKVALFKGI
jgi:hypothetical protein